MKPPDAVAGPAARAAAMRLRAEAVVAHLVARHDLERSRPAGDVDALAHRLAARAALGVTHPAAIQIGLVDAVARDREHRAGPLARGGREVVGAGVPHDRLAGR